ncbi:GNAT family N-acetyltransferase [Aliiroseovarius sp. 2305UL8-7]|uniref:GNAT family N-acetyltransferase n=1 Tax=Aliiroseovarius conchicola TaxID=3121637 RepID=UPI0035281081
MTPRRVASSEDMTPILELLHRAFASMEGRIDPPSSLHRLTAEGIAEQSHTGEVWVIDHKACVFLTPKPDYTPPALYLGKLAVDPVAQGQGLGRQLVKLAEERAHALSFGRLILQTRVELVENHAMFSKLGFRKIAESSHDGYDRITDFTFAKDLVV